MKPKQIRHDQEMLFDTRLSHLLNPKNELAVLSKQIDWEKIDKELSECFCEDNGAPAKNSRLVVGLLILQHLHGISDEKVVFQWVENPYWQLFCGYDYLQWSFPIHPSSLTKWRKRLGTDGLESVLQSIVTCASSIGFVSPCELKNATVDTTVQPKNISYPIDSKLYFRGIYSLVRLCKKFQIPLRQTYTFLAKRASRKYSQYARSRKMKMAARESRRLRTYLGRVSREVWRKIEEKEFLQKIFRPLLVIIDRILSQKRKDSNKVYSLHEPDVECIAKGKAHKKYEFGCKTSIVMTHKQGLMLSVDAVHGNPYDGHTLKPALEAAERISGVNIKRVFVDKGYRGHKITDKEVLISGKRGLSRHFKGLLRRREAIEPNIGHMKSDGKLGRNYLKGLLGDRLNALLCAIGHNVRLILRYLRLHLAPS